MRRRDFLNATLAATGSLLCRPARGAWGGAPDPTASELLLPPGVRAERVLELFLYGGLSPFESFYVVEGHGRSGRYAGEQFHLFEASHAEVFGGCGLPEPWLTPFGTDSAGQQVHLGPLVAPLLGRSDILGRMRVLVQRHDLEPHEAAIPYALSGHRLGSGRLAGLGAAVQRQALSHGDRNLGAPHSYVLYPSSEIATDNLRAASAVGLHPGSARPLSLRISDDMTDLYRSLQRANIGSRRDAYDALVQHYAQDAARRHQAHPAAALDDYLRACGQVQAAGALAEVLSEEALSAVSGEACQVSSFSTTATSMKLAAHLLTHPTSPARHVTLVDGGLIPASGGGGYDVHTAHLTDTARNLSHTLSQLASHIRRPGTSDPGLLDLDETLIVINTEFGRTPFRQQFSTDGTNHHPYGYATVLIGGPASSGVLGAIGEDGVARQYVTPPEARAAVLAAMGIYPFSNATFAVGDLRGISTERDGLSWLNEVVLGAG